MGAMTLLQVIDFLEERFTALLGSVESETAAETRVSNIPTNLAIADCSSMEAPLMSQTSNIQIEPEAHARPTTIQLRV